MKLYEAVAERLQELMEERKTNANRLSKKAGISTSTLTSILYGKSHNTGIATIKLLCDAFPISLDEFFNSVLFKDLDDID